MKTFGFKTALKHFPLYMGFITDENNREGFAQYVKTLKVGDELITHFEGLYRHVRVTSIENGVFVTNNQKTWRIDNVNFGCPIPDGLLDS